MNESCLKVSECAKQTRKSVQTIIRWIKTGYRGRRLYAQKAGRDYRVNRETFEKFLYDTSRA